MGLVGCLKQTFTIFPFFEDYIEYDGYCNTDQGIAYNHYDYAWIDTPGTAEECLAWCRDQKQNSPTSNFVACDYDETYCEIIKDAAVIGGDGSSNTLCWVFVSGKQSKFTSGFNFRR